MPSSQHGDVSYSEFQTGLQQKANIQFDKVDFVEYFNVTADNWQMNNLWKHEDAQAEQKILHDKLHQWFQCAGETCP